MGNCMRNPFNAALAMAAVAMSAGVAWGADLGVKTRPAALATAPWVDLFGGLTFSPDSTYGEGGAVLALNRNLDAPGWLFRFKGGGGYYEYNRAPGLVQGVDFDTFDIMGGYQVFLGPTRVTGYLGGNIEDHQNGDPLATVKGSKAGVKAQGEIFTQLNPSWYFLGL